MHIHTYIHTYDCDISPCIQITKTIGPEHKVLIMGSDGLWDFISNEETLGVAAEKYPEAELVVEMLVKESWRRFMSTYSGQYVDDTTVIVAYLDNDPAPKTDSPTFTTTTDPSTLTSTQTIR